MPDASDLPLAVRLLMDAEDALVRTVEAIPPPGREGHIGVLSAPGGVMDHLAATHRHWFNWYFEGDEAARDAARDPEASYGAGLARFQAAVAEARPVIEALDEDALRRPLSRSTRWRHLGAGYIVRRAIAHLYVHAGDLTVAGSLVGMPDLSLPGPLPRCQIIEADDTSSILLVPLLLDGLDEVRRVGDALPVPAQIGAFARLNAGSWIIAHIANREDLLWNLGMRGRPRDSWLQAADVGRGSARSVPAWNQAREALDRTIAAIAPYLETLTPADLTRTVEFGGTPHPLGAQLARSVAHTFYLAGELQALGSLGGMPDLGLPGFLARCQEG